LYICPIVFRRSNGSYIFLRFTFTVVLFTVVLFGVLSIVSKMTQIVGNQHVNDRQLLHFLKSKSSKLWFSWSCIHIR